MDDRGPSRVSRLEKRRKNSKIMTVLLIIGILLLLLLLWNLMSNDEEESEPSSDAVLQIEESDHDDEDEEADLTDDEQRDDMEENKLENKAVEADINDRSESIVFEQVEPSDDNVIEAYEANWPPIPTEQQETDMLNFDSESLNRQEMEAAIRSAIDMDDPIIWWLSNAGNEQVIGTVSDRQETYIYRVYIRWNEGHGWQPFKVERLKENDQKWRFE